MLARTLAALGHVERLKIVLWLLEHGSARQVEILKMIEADRKEGSLNPGVAAGLLRPLFDAGIVVRPRARGPISLRDREATIRLLQAASAIASDHAGSAKLDADADVAALRRAVIREQQGVEHA